MQSACPNSLGRTRAPTRGSSLNGLPPTLARPVPSCKLLATVARSQGMIKDAEAFTKFSCH